MCARPFVPREDYGLEIVGRGGYWKVLEVMNYRFLETRISQVPCRVMDGDNIHPCFAHYFVNNAIFSFKQFAKAGIVNFWDDPSDVRL